MIESFSFSTQGLTPPEAAETYRNLYDSSSHLPNFNHRPIFKFSNFNYYYSVANYWFKIDNYTCTAAKGWEIVKFANREERAS